MKLSDHLKNLEIDLLSPVIRHSPESVSALLAEGFQEFGSSGRVYSRPEIIAALQQETPVTLTLHDFQMTALAPNAALVTYRSVKEQPGAPPSYALRSSIWIQEEDTWRILFHQGTSVAGPPQS